PTHARTTSDDVDHRLKLAMMVGTSFGARLNDYRTGPQLTRPGARVRNGGGPCHSGGLGRVAVPFPDVHHLHAMCFPVQCLPRATVAALRTEYPSTGFPMQGVRTKRSFAGIR